MMMLKILVVSLAAVALLGATELSAQTKATAEIPFEFNVQNTTLPAGEYTMSGVSSYHNVISIENETGKTIFVLAPANINECKSTEKKNVVRFHRIGDRYFLAEVKTDAVRGHVNPSKQERELTSEGGQPMAAVIVPALSVR